MYFYNLINKLSKEENIIIYVDMDGVIASYDFGKNLDYINKRPIITNIKLLNKIKQINNVELYILSVCRLDKEVEDKNNWLDKYAPFFDKDKRIILAKENYPNLTSKELKCNYLRGLDKKVKTVFIDDDNEVLRFIHSKINDIMLL